MIIRFGDKNFNSIWDDEINKYTLSPFYSCSKQNYFIQRPKDKNLYIKNKSFIVIDNETII